MTEIILTKKKNGMFVLLVNLLVLAAAIVGVIMGAIRLEGGEDGWLFVISMIVLCVGWLPLCGLRVLKPQEALVLTLFGKYIGTL